MLSKLVCTCGASCWVRSSYESDTNATNLDDTRTWEWEGGKEDCPHDDFEITDQEYEEP